MNEGCGGSEMLTKTDDEIARPSVAGLSRLGSGIFVTSDNPFAVASSEARSCSAALGRVRRRFQRRTVPTCAHAP